MLLCVSVLYVVPMHTGMCEFLHSHVATFAEEEVLLIMHLFFSLIFNTMIPFAPVLCNNPVDFILFFYFNLLNRYEQLSIRKPFGIS